MKPAIRIQCTYGQTDLDYRKKTIVANAKLCNYLGIIKDKSMANKLTYPMMDT